MSRRTFASLPAFALAFLTSCQTENTTSPSAEQGHVGDLAMRLPSEVVTATDAEADSIRVRVVPMTGGTAIVRTWVLQAGELILPSVPAVRCSLEVLLVKANTAQPAGSPAGSVTTYRWSSLIDIAPGKTTQADVALVPVSGSLSLNVRLQGNLVNVAPPIPSPAPGSYAGSQVVSLARPAGQAAGTLQYRVENPATGNANPWSNYSAPISISTTSVLYYRTINGADTGLIATGTYTIQPLPSSAPLLLSFTNPVGNVAPFWNGGVSAATGSSASGLLEPWAPAGMAAKVNFSLVGTSFPWVSTRFNFASSNWPNLAALRLFMGTDKPRAVRVSLISSLPAYQNMVSSGASYGATLNVTPGATLYDIPRPQLTAPAWYTKQPTDPSLEQILGTVTGISIVITCPVPSCNESGFLHMDEIRTLP